MSDRISALTPSPSPAGRGERYLTSKYPSPFLASIYLHALGQVPEMETLPMWGRGEVVKDEG